MFLLRFNSLSAAYVRKQVSSLVIICLLISLKYDNDVPNIMTYKQ